MLIMNFNDEQSSCQSGHTFTLFTFVMEERKMIEVGRERVVRNKENPVHEIERGKREKERKRNLRKMERERERQA